MPGISVKVSDVSLKEKDFSSVALFGMETSTRHRERQRIQLKDLTKRHEIPAPAMRKYFFRSSICIMGEILGGRQLEWHPPPEVGDKGVLHASILSQQ